MGTLLSFKPLLGIVDGEVASRSPGAQQGKALEAMQEMLLQQVPERARA